MMILTEVFWAVIEALVAAPPVLADPESWKTQLLLHYYYYKGKVLGKEKGKGGGDDNNIIYIYI